MPNPEYSEPKVSIKLKYALYEVWPDRRIVRTTFDETHYNDAWRDELDLQNILEAKSQGYRGEDKVWRSLVEHEFLHNLVAEIIFDCPSRVLTTENGLSHWNLWQRYEEEAICLAFQSRWHGEADSYISNKHSYTLEFLSKYQPYSELVSAWLEYQETLSRAV